MDPGLRPQTVNEWTAGFEYEAIKDLVVGVRGIYRNQANVIEDGSFDDGDHYFLFNPGAEGTARQPKIRRVATRASDVSDTPAATIGRSNSRLGGGFRQPINSLLLTTSQA